MTRTRAERAAVSCLLVLAACTLDEPVATTCVTDADCSAGRVCVSGQCRSRTTTADAGADAEASDLAAGADATGDAPPVKSRCPVATAAGAKHACAIKADGTLWCWGGNAQGQLGWGTAGGSTTTPVETKGIGGGVATVWAGSTRTCAVKRDGTLWCWGENDFGQVGDGTSGADKLSPAQVIAFGATAVAVSAARYHSCALKRDGTVWCWGYNAWGDLGDGTTNDKLFPVPVTSLGADAVGIAVAGVNCALKRDGTLWCWGGPNSSGQLGDGTTMERHSPVHVAALGVDAVEVAPGGGHTCGRKRDGTLWCWGANAAGQLGNGTRSTSRSPVPVTALGADVVGVYAGTAHTCARKRDGTLWCWGANALGQVGDGTSMERFEPVLVTALGTGVVDVALGSDFSCAAKADGTLWCWGDSGAGQLGNGTTGADQCTFRMSLRPCQLVPARVMDLCP